MKIYNLDEFLLRPTPNVEALIEPDILVPGGSLIIYGKAGSFKSWIAIDLAFAMTSGDKWLEQYATAQGDVLILQSEQIWHQYRGRLAVYRDGWNQLGKNEVGASRFHIMNEVNFPLSTPQNQSALESIIESLRPSILIIDNLFRVIPVADSEEAVLKNLTARLAVWQEKFNCAVVIIHHPRKEGIIDRGFDEMRGTGVLNNWVDTIARVERVEGLSDMTTMTFQKGRNFGQVEPMPSMFQLTRNPTQLVFKGVTS